METPYLDKEIEAEKAWAKAYGAKETENEKLTEFKAIKQALSLSVVGQSLPKQFSNEAYHKARKLRYEEFVEWWDKQT